MLYRALDELYAGVHQLVVVVHKAQLRSGSQTMAEMVVSVHCAASVLHKGLSDVRIASRMLVQAMENEDCARRGSFWQP